MLLTSSVKEEETFQRKKIMMKDFEISDLPEGVFLPLVATFGIVGNLGRNTFQWKYSFN